MNRLMHMGGDSLAIYFSELENFTQQGFDA